MQYRELRDITTDIVYGNDGKPIWVQSDEEGSSNSLWRHTITIYNKKIDFKEKTVKWYVHIIHNCFWGIEIDESKRGGGFQAYSSDERHIHTVPAKIVRIPMSRKYQTPEEWNAYPNGFTVKPDDIIFKGIVVNAMSGKTENEVLNQYGNKAMIVKYVSDNTDKSDYIKHIHAEGY